MTKIQIKVKMILVNVLVNNYFWRSTARISNGINSVLFLFVNIFCASKRLLNVIPTFPVLLLLISSFIKQRCLNLAIFRCIICRFTSLLFYNLNQLSLIQFQLWEMSHCYKITCIYCLLLQTFFLEDCTVLTL